MTDRSLEVDTYAENPWEDLAPNVRIGNLNGLLGLTADEWGLVAGADLDDVTAAHVIVSKNYMQLHFAGATDAIKLDENGDTTIYADEDDRVVIKVNGVEAVTIDRDAITFYNEEGLACKWISRSEDSYDEQPDLIFHNRGGIAAMHSLGLFIDSNNQTEHLGDDPSFSFFRDGDTFLDAVEMVRITETGEIWFVDDGVAHGATDIIDETTVYGGMGLHESGAGGFQITGLKDSDVASGEEGAALVLRAGLEANVEVGSNTTARSIMEFYAGQLSGTDWANVVANGNCYGFRAYVGGSWLNCVLIDEDGDIKYRGSLQTFDEEDDVQALNDLYYLATGQAHQITRYDLARLAAMRIVERGDDGALYLRSKGVQALTLGAFRQMNARQRVLIAGVNRLLEDVQALQQGTLVIVDRLQDLEARVAVLERAA